MTFEDVMDQNDREIEKRAALQEHVDAVGAELKRALERVRALVEGAARIERARVEAVRQIKQAEWRLKNAEVFAGVSPDLARPLTAYLDSIGEEHYT